MVKIRLKRLGRKHRPYYRICVMNSTSKRDGKTLADIGKYDPMATPKLIDLDIDVYNSWLEKGAQPTNTVKFLAHKVATQ